MHTRIMVVLYNGKQPGLVKLGSKNIQAGMLYKLGKEIAKADSKGKACFSVPIDRRTAATAELQAV